MENAITCEKCCKIYKNMITYKQHLTLNRCKIKILDLSCKICDKTFSRHQTKQIHELKCKNKLSLSDLKEILKQNKNLNLNDKCLENLILFDNSNIISYVIKTYKLQPTMKCVKIAIDNKWSSYKIKILFDPIYLDYLEKEKKIEIKNEPIECVPKKKNNISSK